MKKVLIFLGIFFLVIFQGCKDKTAKPKEDERSSLIEQGTEIASGTFLALSTKLKEAMKAGGVEGAMAYCNVNALPITDSLSKVYNVDIKRTSLKYRNPNNKPSLMEMVVLNEYDRTKKDGLAIQPKISQEEGYNIFHAPIIVHDLCLKCHGMKDEMEDYNKILKYYPEDLAHSYEVGDLRGMWSIRFLK